MRWSRRQSLGAMTSSAPAARPRTGSDFGGDLEAIAIAHGQCNTLAVYAFKLQRIRRICVQSSEFVAKVQLTAHNIKSCGKARHAWIDGSNVNRRSFVQSRSYFVLRQSDNLGPFKDAVH